MSGSPGRVEGRSGSSRAFAIRSSRRLREAAQGQRPERGGLAGERRHLLEVRDLGFSPARAGEGREDAGRVVEPREEGGDARVPPHPVELVEERHGRREGGGPRPLLVDRPGPQRPAGERVGDHVAVAHPEERRAERGHEGDPVGGVVDRAEDRERLVDLLAVEEGLAALHGEAERDGLERLLERLHAGEPPGEDEDVARPARARGAGHGVAHRLPAAREGGEVRGEARGLRAEEVLAARVRGRGEAQGHDRGLVGEARRGRDRLVGRLVGLVRRLDEVGEDAVHEAEDGRARAEVLHEVQDARPPLRLAGELVEEAHLRPPEAVDRLLGVAHDDERSRAIAREEPRDLDLQRVGVLELVDDEVLEAAAEPLADGGVVAQRVARLDQQVQEVENAPLGLLAVVERGDAGERADEPAVERGPVRGRPRRDRLPRPHGEGAPLGERLGRGPARVEAQVLLDRLEGQQVVDEGFSLEEARGLGGFGEPLEPGSQGVALLRRGRELAGPRRPSPRAPSGPPRRRRPLPRAARGRAGRGGSARGLAATCARPTPRPRAGCRGRGRRGARRPRPPGALPATPPRPPRTGRPPGPRPPCGSRAGRRTRAAAPGGPGRTARGWSRRWRARAPRGRRSRGARSSSGTRASARALSSRSRRRSFMVVAAFSVKVTAAISSSRAAPVRTIASMRSTRSVVLPVPAPASITRLVAWSRRARSRASSSTGRKPLTRRPSAGGTPGAPGRGP